jgi:hypothetical protein
VRPLDERAAGRPSDHLASRLIGVAQFDRWDDQPEAELAIEVARDWQRAGPVG